jgi:hypothetical protein
MVSINCIWSFGNPRETKARCYFPEMLTISEGS